MKLTLMKRIHTPCEDMATCTILLARYVSLPVRWRMGYEDFSVLRDAVVELCVFS